MTPPIDDDYTPMEATERLHVLCDELERRQVPLDQVQELRDLNDRFHRHMQALPVFWERLQDYARRQRPCW